MPRYADAALQRGLVHKGLLHRVELRVAGEPLDRADLGAVAHGGELQAGGDRVAVHDHRASTASADAAAVLGAGEVQVFTEHVHKQAVAGLEVDLNGVSVELEFDQHSDYFSPRSPKL